jgi:2-haloacid dehalogenase
MKPFYVFDAYGTLFDVASPVRRHAEAIGPLADKLADIWRIKQLEYTWVRSMSGTYQNFEVLTASALDYAFASLDLKDDELRGRLIDAYKAPDCYEEVPAALAALRSSGVKTAILSNGTPAMLESAVTAAEIGQHFNAILSVDRAEMYKVSSEAYRLVTRYFDCAPSEVSFQSSNRWDIAGAAAFGFHTVWVNRRRAPSEYEGLGPDREIGDLSRL